MRYSQNRPAKQYAPQTQINHNNRLRQSNDWTPLIHSLLLRFDQERIVKGELHIKQPLKVGEEGLLSELSAVSSSEPSFSHKTKVWFEVHAAVLEAGCFVFLYFVNVYMTHKKYY